MHNFRCVHEYMDVYSEAVSGEAGELVTSPFGGRYCGPIPPRRRVSLHRAIAISFFTDKTYTPSTLFHGTYRFINDCNLPPSENNSISPSNRINPDCFQLNTRLARPWSRRRARSPFTSLGGGRACCSHPRILVPIRRGCIVPTNSLGSRDKGFASSSVTSIFSTVDLSEFGDPFDKYLISKVWTEYGWSLDQIRAAVIFARW